MKTIIRLAIIWAVAGTTVNTVTAQQVIPQPSQPKTFDHGNGGSSNNQQQPKGGNPNDKWWVSVGVGGGPNYGPPPPNYGPGYGGGYYGNGYGYNNYYGGNYYGYSYRKAARRTIRNTAYVIYNAIQQAQWNGMYNPILSNAVQHQQHAKYLYNCGDFMGALYHSKRARYLAWESLNFNYGMIQNPGYDDWDDDMYGGNYNGGGYNGGGYYNDDYYKKNGNGDVGKQKQPGDPNVKIPSNEELDNKVQKKNFTKEEMKEIKLNDLDVQ